MKPESRCEACEARFLENAPVFIPFKALQVGSSLMASTGLWATFAVGALVVTQNLAAWSLVALVSGLTSLYGIRGYLNNKEAAKVQEAREQFLLEGPGDVAKQLPARSLGGDGD